jgi:hypothetical protein
MAPLFSVLLPTHYRPDSIGLAIRSVLAQTEADFELLIVGDGAVAGTAEAVAGFSDPRIRWFDLPKAPGYGYANRNIAMAEARGSLVTHMADDDIMLPNHLALLRTTFEDPAVLWAYSQALWVSADGIAAPDLTNLAIEDERTFFYAVENSISGTVFAYRRSAFETTRPWPEDAISSADWLMMRDLLVRHGPGRVARTGVPTMLHFAAGRKQRRDSHFPQLAAWLAMADAAPWWPEALWARTAPGQLPQEWYLERLEREPGFHAELRRGVDTIVARAARERLDPRFTGQAGRAELQQSLEAAQAKVRQLERTVAELEGRTAKLSEELAFRDMLLGPGKP